ncbi:MAG: mechanosensitive ion channel family protein [Hyphomicrobiaceae bacterium]
MSLSEMLSAGLGGQPQQWDKLLGDWHDLIVNSINNVASLWTIYQLAIVLAMLVISRLIGGYVENALENAIRKIKHQPGLLRILITVIRRTDTFVLAVLLGIATAVLLRVTWPSNTYIVRISADLVLAWGIVSTVSRLIRNRALSKLAATVGWIVAALIIVGWMGTAISLMDAAGVEVSGTRITLLLIVKCITLLAVMVWIASVLGEFLERRMREGFELSPAMQVLTGKLVRWLLLVVAVLVSLSVVGVDLTALTVLSGAVGIGIGLGLQKLASNLISGVIILSDKSIKPGDMITLGTMRGTINTLHARYVSVLTLTGAELLVPNERFVTETVVNWSYSDRRMLVEVTFGVDYRSDPHQVQDVALSVVSDVSRILKQPPPRCQLRNFGDSSIDFVLLFWIDDPERGVNNIKSEILFKLWDAFKRENINIPFPHREVILHHANNSDAAEGGVAAEPEVQSSDNVTRAFRGSRN